jgi:hypothetical protein
MTAETPEDQPESSGTRAEGPLPATRAGTSCDRGAGENTLETVSGDEERSSVRPVETAAGTNREEAEQRTEHAVAQLFEAAGIKRIVCVDDVFAATVDTLLEQLADFTAEQRAAVFDGRPEYFREEEVWQQRVREEWGRRSDPEQASLVDKAFAIDKGVEPVHTGAVHALQAVLPADLVPRGLSLHEWEQERETLIDETDTTPTLILFDQDFSHESEGSTAGQRIIAELEASLQAGAAGDGVFYGLLTNTVSPEEEHERRQQIVQEASLDPRRLVVISKRNLDYERFADRLRTTLLAPTLADLTREVTGQLHGQQQAAISHAETIPPEEMERMVIRSSDREGDWPPDTLVRVLGAIQRAKVREQLRMAPRVQELTRRLQSIAAVATPAATAATSAQSTSTPGPPTSPPPYPLAASILRGELYDDAEQVNSLHLPIELGDLIERPSTKQVWIVLAQPCDLMVRGGGRRAPELTHVILGKVADPTTGRKDLFSEFELPYYDLDHQTPKIVRLSRIAYVRTVVLDACVLNESGDAQLDLRQTPPSRLLPHWQTRWKELSKVGKKLLNRAGQAGTDIDKDTITGHYKGDPFPPLHVDHENERIEWDCRRIGRVGEPYARALLTRFSQYYARDAYLSDLAR